jgi:long-chain fatty acid transport protein
MTTSIPERARTIAAGRHLTASAIVLSLAAGPALATGFFVNQQSVRGMGRVNAGVTAAADDPSTIFFNPAGLARLWRKDSVDGNTWISVGTQVIVPRSDVRNTGSVASTPGTLGAALPYAGNDFRNPSDPTPIPNLYLAKRLPEDHWYFGFGITAPFGLTTEYSPDWFGRYDAIEASLRTVNFGIVGAYALSPTLSIGAGIDYQQARSRLIAAIPNPLTPGGPTVATDARIETSGSAWSPGFNIGLLWGAADHTRVGVHYRSGVEHTIRGSAVTTGFTGPLAAANGSVGARAKVKLPAILSVGVAHPATEGLTLLANIEWYGWKSFDETRLQFADGRPDAVRPTQYRNTWAVAVGADYRVSAPLTLRGGVRLDRTPTVDGFRDVTFPDADRLWVGVGATYQFLRQWRADVALKHAFFRKGDIAVTRTFFDGTPLTSTVAVNGTADSSTSTVSLNVSYAF